MQDSRWQDTDGWVVLNARTACKRGPRINEATFTNWALNFFPLLTCWKYLKVHEVIGVILLSLAATIM